METEAQNYREQRSIRNLTEQEFEEILQTTMETGELNAVPHDLTEEQKQQIYMQYLEKQKNQQNQDDNGWDGKNNNKNKKILSLQDIPEKERMYMIVDKDTGHVIDIRDEKVVAELVQENSLFTQPSTQVWNQFWKNVRKINEELLDEAERGNLEGVKKCLSKEQIIPVDLNYKGLDDWTPLHNAVFNQHFDVVKYLINQGANIESATSFQRRALHIVAITGNVQIGQFLIDQNVDINAQDQELETPLHFAVEKNQEKFVELLLQAGAKTDLLNQKKKYPLDVVKTHNVWNVFARLKKLEHKNENLTKFMNPKFGTEDDEGLHDFDTKADEKVGPKDFKYYKKLGSGAFGEVYLVRYKANNQIYAMKILKKERIIKDKIQRYTITEKEVLAQMNHPFITRLYYSFQDDLHLYLILEYCPGGDLNQLLKKYRKLNENVARIYIAEILLALEALHRDMIIYRDLKPDNVILDGKGHAKLTDFGLAKKNVADKTHSFLGTPAYFAPEIVKKSGHNRVLDWYNLGVLLYELLVGMPPFYAMDRQQLYENIKKAPLKIPKSMSPQAKDLILKLLNRNPSQRLGAKRDGEEIRQHPFFDGIDWDDAMDGKLMPPLPQIKEIPEKEIKAPYSSQDQNLNKFKDWTEIIQE